MKRFLFTVLLLIVAGAMTAQNVDITFNVNMSQYPTSPDGVFLAGGGTFGDPGDNPMSDTDGDDIWTITVSRPAGETSFYTFTNGNCPNYSCKEDIVGQACAAGQFNDRQYINVSSDTVINTCFSECTDNTMCTPVQSPINVTFQIMIDTADASGMFIGGNFENWAGGVAMTDTDGDDVWTADVALSAGTYEFKFINGVNFRNGGETLDSIADLACTLTTGIFTNRVFTISGTTDTTLCIATFGECCPGASIDDLIVDNNLFVLRPTVTSNYAFLDFPQIAGETAEVKVLNSVGQVMNASETSSSTLRLDVQSYAKGLYFVQVKIGNTIGTKKMIVE